jgi:hypothetical protein
MSDGTRLTSKVEFSHDIPAGPHITSPRGHGTNCGAPVPIPTLISWQPVSTSIDGKPIEISGYEVVIETDSGKFDVILSADATMVTVPGEFLQPGTSYTFEVLAIADSGNQTITEGCFVTAK